MNLIWKRASAGDIEILTASRVQVLRAANRLSVGEDMSEVEKASRRYYKECLADGSHVAFLVLDTDRAGGDTLVGAGGISFYRVMPTYHNPTGEKGYIMNMYTHPDYRRKGIAYKTLDLLVKEAAARGIGAISLEATDSGRPLYEKYGFVPMKAEMELPDQTAESRPRPQES